MGSPPRRPGSLRDERGSVILMSIVLVFVMTLLGLALFDLGAIENRMSLTSQADARAFEIAQAGIERALRELQDGFVNEAAGIESWADNDGLHPVCSPLCVPGAYRPMTLADTSVPGGGSYSVEIMLVTVNEANRTSPYPIALTCYPDLIVATTCANLVFVRSTGTLTSAAGAGDTPAPPGYTAQRTIQVLARAYPASVLANGLVAGTPSSAQPVNGSVQIAGSVHILGSPVGALPALSLSGSGAGVANNLGNLGPTAATPDAEILRRLPAQQAICLPSVTGCVTPTVYSLGAEIAVARPTTQAPITLASSAFMGGAAGPSHATGGSTPGSLPGKGPLDTISVADGCQASDCSDSYGVTSPSNPPVVDFGAIGRAYPENPVTPFPLLTGTNPVLIGGASYANLQTYFSGRAASAATMNLDNAGRPGHAAGMNSNEGNWSSSTVTFTNKNGVSRQGRVCWTRSTGVLVFGVSSAGNPCNSPATAADPLIIYNTGPWIFNRTASLNKSDAHCPGTQICINGVAVIYNTGAVSIQETVTSLCTVATLCGPEKFPTNDMLALLSAGTVTVGTTSTPMPRVMAFLYAGTDLVARTTPGGGGTTRIVGGMAASRFCFGGAGACPGGTTNLPEFYQAPFDARFLPEELLALAPTTSSTQAPKRWRVESVPRLWLECRPGPGALPTTPTGVCSY